MNVTTINTIVANVLAGKAKAIPAQTQLTKEGIDSAIAGAMVALAIAQRGKTSSANVLAEFGIGEEDATPAKSSKTTKGSKPATNSPKTAKRKESTKTARQEYGDGGYEFSYEEGKAYSLAETELEGIELVANLECQPWGVKFGRSNTFTRIDRIEKILEIADDLRTIINSLKQ